MGTTSARYMFGVGVLLLGCSNQPVARRTPDSTAQAYIRQVTDSLPPDSSVRRTLEGDQYANGVHETWMDDMRTAELREVMFEVHGVWRTGLGFRPKSIHRIIYRTRYDGPGSQLMDTDRIAKIRALGLEAKLQKAAFVKARDAKWPFESRISILGVNCFSDVYLFDDEWITDLWRPVKTPIMGAYDPSEAPLLSAAQVGDLLGTSNLLKSRTFSKSDLNSALFSAMSYPSDNTDVIRLLIGAGADPNAAREYGTTVLMESIDYFNGGNIKLLVASGADRSRKNRAGETALSILQKRIATAPRPMPTYVAELVDLLTPDH